MIQTYSSKLIDLKLDENHQKEFHLNFDFLLIDSKLIKKYQTLINMI